MSRETSSRPQIQVFIPVYNDIRFLPAAIESVLGQRDVDVRVLVSDNASTDGTWAYLDEIAASDKRVIVHRNRDNIGMMPNLNRFRELITADYYMVLCSDDLLGADDALKSALEVLEREPDVVSVYCDMLFIDGHGRKLMTRHFGRSGRFSAEAALRGSIISQRNLFGIPLLHRSAVGLSYDYPADLSYTGDVVHSARCGAHGCVFHIPKVLIHNRYTGRNLTASLQQESLKQFRQVAGLFSIELTALERIWQRLQASYMSLSKRVFLRYAAMRSSNA